MDNNVIDLVGGKPVFGEVVLSGDTDAAIVLVVKALFEQDEVLIDNVPRSINFINFLKQIEKIGLKNIWLDLDTVKIFIDKCINDDLGELNFEDRNINKLLIPLVLFREANCFINDSERSEAKFFREIGFIVEVEAERIHIKVPNFLKDISEIQVVANDSFTYAARSFINNLFNSALVLRFEKNNFFIDDLLQLTMNKKVYHCPFSISEFEFWASLVLLTNGELTVYNFDASLFTNFLSVLTRMGLNYEVQSNKVKLWTEQNRLVEYYDFTGFEVDEICTFIIILNKRNSTSKGITVLVRKTTLLLSLIKDLNILGLDINIVNHLQKGGSLWLIKLLKSKAINHSKLSVSNYVNGFAIFLISLYSDGNHKITNYNVFFRNHYCLLDKLKNVGIKIDSDDKNDKLL